MIQRHNWPDLKSFLQIERILVSAVLASLSLIHSGRTADGPNSVTTLDPVFSAGFATLKQAAGFIEDPPNQSPTDWKPNLQLWIGVKAVEGNKRTVFFVQLTTLALPTNSFGQTWPPELRTNHWAWSPSNKTQFVMALYPVRARVFDETGRELKEGQTPMAWGMLTNGLMDMCRLGFEAYHRDNQTNSPLTEGEGKIADVPKPHENVELMRAMGGGFLWLIGMFGDFQTVPTVAKVWETAQCAIRWPSAWTLVTSLFTGFSVSLEPRLKDVTLVPGATAGPAGQLYRLPLELNSGKRNLSRVEIIVGPAHGAEMLLAGIRSIRALHPTKPEHEFLAQVLAAGTVRPAEH
jgi:hypothetical protein